MVDWYLIDKLSAMSSYKPDTDRLIYLEDNWGEFEEAEYWGVVQKLKDNQLDPIVHALNYGQKDIMRHLKKLR